MKEAGLLLNFIESNWLEAIKWMEAVIFIIICYD